MYARLTDSLVYSCVHISFDRGHPHFVIVTNREELLNISDDRERFFTTLRVRETIKEIDGTGTGSKFGTVLSYLL